MQVPVSRRAFLERAALGTAALALLKPGTAFAAQTGMYASLAPWAVARGVGWPEQARLAARVGYKGIDWAWGPVRAAGVDATRALMAELGIRPTIVNLPGPNPLTVDEATFKASLPQLSDDAAFCASIGCHRFQRTLGATTAGGRSKEEHWKFVRDRLAAVSEVIVKHDVHLGLEFLGPLHFRTGSGSRGRQGGGPGTPVAGQAAPAVPAVAAAPPVPFVWSLAETVKLCTESGPNLGATLDVWHWYHSEGTIADILATDKARVIHVHLSDAREMPPAEVHDSMRLLPGEGIIDLVGFLQALRKIGWEGAVACETIGPRIPDNMPPEESARLGLETTTVVMKKAGVL